MTTWGEGNIWWGIQTNNTFLFTAGLWVLLYNGWVLLDNGWILLYNRWDLLDNCWFLLVTS